MRAEGGEEREREKDEKKGIYKERRRKSTTDTKRTKKE